MHFYGMSWKEVQGMPFSRFAKLYKCASMIDARKTLLDIDVACFTSMEKSSRDKFTRKLKNATDEHMIKALANFGSVVKSLAKRMLNNG